MDNTMQPEEYLYDGCYPALRRLGIRDTQPFDVPVLLALKGEKFGKRQIFRAESSFHIRRINDIRHAYAKKRRVLAHLVVVNVKWDEAVAVSAVKETV